MPAFDERERPLSDDDFYARLQAWKDAHPDKLGGSTDGKSSSSDASQQPPDLSIYENELGVLDPDAHNNQPGFRGTIDWDTVLSDVQSKQLDSPNSHGQNNATNSASNVPSWLDTVLSQANRTEKTPNASYAEALAAVARGIFDESSEYYAPHTQHDGVHPVGPNPKILSIPIAGFNTLTFALHEPSQRAFISVEERDTRRNTMRVSSVIIASATNFEGNNTQYCDGQAMPTQNFSANSEHHPGLANDTLSTLFKHVSGYLQIGRGITPPQVKNP